LPAGGNTKDTGKGTAKKKKLCLAKDGRNGSTRVRRGHEGGGREEEWARECLAPPGEKRLKVFANREVD